MKKHWGKRSLCLLLSIFLICTEITMPAYAAEDFQSDETVVEAADAASAETEENSETENELQATEPDLETEDASAASTADTEESIREEESIVEAESDEEAEIIIITQPVNCTGALGDTVTFTVEASGDGLSYQWQLSDDSGETWRNSSTKKAVYSTTLTTTNNGRMVQCVITDSYGNSVVTDSAKMSVAGVTITAQPEDYTGVIGDTVTFTVEASGDGLSYQWQLSDDDGETWRNSSTKKATYSTTLTTTNDGRAVRCVVTDSSGNSETSSAAYMKVATIEITVQPEDFVGNLGDTVTFTVEASGENLSYQWQLSDDSGETWRNSSTKKAVYSTTLTTTNNGRMVQCVIADSYGNSVVTDSATMSVAGVTITAQPEDYAGAIGDAVTFTVEASGDGLSYQWQLSDDDGETWRNSSTKKAVYSTTLTTANHGRMVQCVITDSYGNSVVSDSAKMSVAVVTITAQPEDYTGVIGDTVTFTVEALGDGLSYQWQLSDDDGETWRNSSTKKATYSTTLTTTNDGRAVRCVVTDSSGNSETSSAAYMKAATIEITVQPEDFVGNLGDTATFTVEASGESLSYQWQLSDDSGETWRNSSTKKAVYSTTLTSSNNGRMVQCVITDSYGNSAVTDSATMSVAGVTITSQPEDYTGAIGDTVTFTVEASGDGLSYQWQLSDDDGETWRDSSTKKATYSTTLTTTNDGRAVRCVVTDSSGNSEISSVAYMKASIIEITVQPEDFIGAIGDTATFTVEASGEGLSYQWQLSDDDGETWRNSSTKKAVYSTTLTTTNIGRMVQCVITDSYGTSVTSASAVMKTTGVEITMQPEDYTGIVGDSIQFIVEATGTDLSYQWQLSDDDGENWRNSSVTSNVYGVTLSESNDGRSFRCVVSDCYGNEVVSDAAKLQIGEEFEEGWYVRNNTVYYRYSDGTYANGLLTIDGEIYYFNSDGSIITGFQTLDDVLYYFDPETGKALTGFCLDESTGNTYYLQGSEGAYTGTLTLSNSDGSESTYYFYDTGIMAHGLTKQSGVYYYYDFLTGEQITGLVKLADTVYMYFDETGAIASGWTTWNGGLYYFDETYGRNLSGWATIESSQYYFDETTGQAVSGIVEIEGSYYYFDESCEMQTGLIEYDGQLYYFNSSAQSGVNTVEDQIYCFDAETYQAVSGWYTTESEETYYFSEDTFTAVTGICEIDGIRYGFSDNGVLQTGIYSDEDGALYYCSEYGESVSGIVTLDDQIYYVDADTQQLLTGLQQVGDDYYYFNTDGTAYRDGLLTINGSMYYFDSETGKAQEGFITMASGSTYCFDAETKAAVSGICLIDGDYYYFDEDCIMQTGFQKDSEGNAYYFNPESGKAQSEFVTRISSSGTVYTYYMDPETKIAVTGLITIDEGLYYFDENGYMQTGRKTIDGKFYYFDEVTGKAITGIKVVTTSSGTEVAYYYNGSEGASTGLFTVDGNLYYADESTGYLATGRKSVDGVYYYFDPDTYKAIYGIVLDSSSIYYFAESGTSAGFASYGGVTYYVSSTGKASLNAIYTNSDGIRCYFGENGEQEFGLIPFTNSSGTVVTRYFTSTSDAVASDDLLEAIEAAKAAGDGWAEVEGLTYYVSDGEFLTGLQSIDGASYYFSSLSGAMLTGLRTIDGTQYYFDPETGKMATGWTTVEGKKFYFDPETGAMCTGFTVIGSSTYYLYNGGGYATTSISVNGTSYSFDADGAMLYEDELSYYDASTGEKLSNTWYEVDGSLYYLDADGCKVTGMVNIDGETYIFDESGVLCTGWYSDSDGSVYYCTESGLLRGFQTIDDLTYYFNTADGVMLTGLRIIDAQKYYFAASGELATGWIEENGYVYYFDSDGLATGLKEIDGNNYYFLGNGVMMTGWVYLYNDDGEGGMCLFLEDGSQATGLTYYGGYWYYFDEDNNGARTYGWFTIESDEFYFAESNGKAVTGRQYIDGAYYYFDVDSAIRQYGLNGEDGKYYYYVDLEISSDGVLHGLQTIDDDLYYFNLDSGKMLSGMYIIDDVKYYFDADTGKALEGVYFVDDELTTAYYFMASGGLKYGLQEWNGATYYLNYGTGKMVTGLASVGDTLYYFAEDGKMVVDSEIEIAGLIYQIDENGAVTLISDASGQVTDVVSMLQYGLTLLGLPYSEENSSSAGYHCSGLVAAMLSAIGYDLTGSAYHQCYSLVNGLTGYDVEVLEDTSSLQVGDLLFMTELECSYGDDCEFWNEIHHVAIYVGDGKAIHANTYSADGSIDDEHSGVMVSDFTNTDHFFVCYCVHINY